MAVAKLHFTARNNSFSVSVENLETLSVEQIQELESFVSKRKGIFDFNTYSFVIQKRLEFNDFVKLIHESSVSAICIDNPIVRAARDRVGFGQYKGMFYDELPNSYLSWLKTNYNGYDKDKILKELKKRKI